MMYGLLLLKAGLIGAVFKFIRKSYLKPMDWTYLNMISKKSVKQYFEIDYTVGDTIKFTTNPNNLEYLDKICMKKNPYSFYPLNTLFICIDMYQDSYELFVDTINLYSMHKELGMYAVRFSKYTHPCPTPE